MGPPAVAELVERIAHRASSDSHFAGVLAALLDAPTDDAGELAHLAAASLNQTRRQSVLEEFRHSALTTSDVQRLLRRSRPQSVHVLRSRGKVLGRTIGNITYFPTWQFDEGELRADLDVVLAALHQFTNDAVTADRIMRLRRPELGGASLAEGLRDPKRAPAAWNILSNLGSGH